MDTIDLSLGTNNAKDCTVVVGGCVVFVVLVVVGGGVGGEGVAVVAAVGVIVASVMAKGDE